MKINPALIISAILFSPAAYAIISWFILDARRGTKTEPEMVALYKSVLPFPDQSFTAHMFGLIAFSVAGIIVLKFSRTNVTGIPQTVKTILAILGIAEIGMLLFSLM